MSFRDICKKPGVKVGTMVAEFNTPGIGHILKAVGFDYAFLDMEHSGIGMADLKSTLRYFEAADLPVMLRPPSKSYHHIARALDIGADALLLPMVGNADVAREVASYFRYPPQGQRGVALNMAHDRYTGGNTKAKLAAANRSNMLIALVETAEGLENVEEIAAVKGIDALWIGHFDLSTSMGISGQFTDRRFTAALKRIGAAAAANNKPLGQLLPSPAEAIKRFNQGTEIICYSGDVALLQGAARAGLEKIRAGCKTSVGKARKGKK
jgi:2-keto-3-deoxy-L-rhamnonate aldolase RhmA